MPPAIAQPREIWGTGIWGMGDVLSIETLFMGTPSPAGKEDFPEIKRRSLLRCFPGFLFPFKPLETDGNDKDRDQRGGQHSPHHRRAEHLA